MVSTQQNKWLVPLIVGLLIGAVASGAPLWYKTTQLQAQLAAGAASITQLQADKSRLQAEQAQLRDAQQQLQAQAQSEQAVIQAQQVRAAELAKPDLPIQVSFRHALVSQGLVLTMRNHSATSLEVLIQFTGSAARSPVYRILIPTNGVKEFGGMEGWAVNQGDLVTIINPNYRPIRVRAP